MTYKDLYLRIQDMTKAQKSMDVTILDCEENEFYAVTDFEVTEGQDVLDEGHPILSIKEKV